MRLQHYLFEAQVDRFHGSIIFNNYGQRKGVFCFVLILRYAVRHTSLVWAMATMITVQRIDGHSDIYYEYVLIKIILINCKTGAYLINMVIHLLIHFIKKFL